MRSTKKPVTFQSVSLPVDFVRSIQKHIKDKPNYRSLADFVKIAILEQMKMDNSTLMIRPPEFKENNQIQTIMKEIKEIKKILKEK